MNLHRPESVFRFQTQNISSTIFIICRFCLISCLQLQHATLNELQVTPLVVYCKSTNVFHTRPLDLQGEFSQLNAIYSSQLITIKYSCLLFYIKILVHLLLQLSSIIKYAIPRKNSLF